MFGKHTKTVVLGLGYVRSPFGKIITYKKLIGTKLIV